LLGVNRTDVSTADTAAAAVTLLDDAILDALGVVVVVVFIRVGVVVAMKAAVQVGAGYDESERSFGVSKRPAVLSTITVAALFLVA
jgi:hypothetical protein